MEPAPVVDQVADTEVRAAGTTHAQHEEIDHYRPISVDGSLVCENIDVVVHHILSSDLLRTLAEIVVKQRISLESKDTIEKTRCQIEEALGRLTTSDITEKTDLLELVRDHLSAFVRNRPRSIVGFVTSLTSGASARNDEIEKMASKLQEEQVWKARSSFARDLIRNLDQLRKHDTCGQIFGTDQDLAQHRKECPLRSVVCPNQGCGRMFAQRNSIEHDQICVFKVEDCPKGCGEGLARRDIDKHCTTVCGMRLIDCAFKELGCQELIPQMRMSEHLNDFVHPHLLLCMKGLSAQRGAVQSLTTQFSVLQAEVAAEADLQKKIVQQLTELDKHAKASDKELSKVRKLTEESEKTLKTVQSLSKQLDTKMKQIETDVYQS
eukprot:c15582_g1_i1.p1 GENE.c15582_g1_i1~~c15582_g1_i1.p1  ORF type:complete len:379 (+),score=84.29 c15582_g1_i1:42-1178(+)